MRARFALLQSGAKVTIREILLREKPVEMLAISPKGTVPVLQLPDGRVIEESLEIMAWALSLCDPDGWLARHDPELISENDGTFKRALDRYKYPGRFGPIDPLEARAVGLGFLERLEARLAAKGFLSGGRLGVTDIAIFPFVRQFAATDNEWFTDQSLPELKRWLACIVGSPEYTVVMYRYPTWQPEDTAVPFPI